MNIDRISIYAGGSTNAIWYETTPINVATSPAVMCLAGDALFGITESQPHYYSQLTWNPDDPVLWGQTNLTRTFTLPEPNPKLAIEGFEVVGSAEILRIRPIDGHTD